MTNWKIFPSTITHDGRKVPVRDFHWKEDCTNDPSVIASWSQLYPQLKHYSVPTGETNDLLVLDVDVKSGGLDTIKKYHVPLTMSQRTPSGGIHYIFKYPKDGKHYGNRAGFDNGLDIRGRNGYICYYGTDSTPIADAPDWLLEAALSNKEEKTVSIEDAVKVDPVIVNEILNSACDNVRNAPEGERNNTLNVESYKVGQLLASNSIARDEAFNALFDVAKEINIEDYEAKATIESGFKGGVQFPLTSPFGNTQPMLNIPVIESEPNPRWTPNFFSKYDLTNISKLRKPQIFKDWATEDIHITTADGGTGKTTLKLYEAICLALGESFLGFECKAPGRTLYITGEDTAGKLGAMIGAILKQMGILDDDEKVRKILNSIVVKKDTELCLISRSKEGFITVNHEALAKVLEAVEDIRPKMIVFDPIANFWGSESAVNDMSRAVVKFMGALVEKSNACVEVINHIGKQSSNNKDMGQFAGRGGTGLPSHARVSRSLRPIFEEEFEELTGMQLTDKQSAILCNVNKFSDGSPLYNKPFLILREGYLFSRIALIEQKVKQEQNKMSNVERIFTFIKNERLENRYPTKDIIIGRFMSDVDNISRAKIGIAINELRYAGHMGEKLKMIENPDPEVSEKIYIITDMEGKEL